MSVPSTCGRQVLRLGEQAAMQQAMVTGSSPVLQAADRCGCRARALARRKASVRASAEPIPVALVAEEIGFVGRDFLEEGVPFGVAGLEAGEWR